MSREHGKKMWATLLPKRDPGWEVLVLQDDGNGDRRALSLAYAVADALRLPRESTIFKAGDGDGKAREKDESPNRGLYEATRTARGLVVM